MAKTDYQTIDDYIAAADEAVRPILQEIRQRTTAALPDAQETISYQMPALRHKRVFFYFAAFKQHIGIYPPVRDAELAAEVAPFANEKGNLRFRLDRPIPYDLITRIAVSQALSELG